MTIWVPKPEEPEQDPTIQMAIKLAWQAEPSAIRILELYIRKIGRQHIYLSELMRLVFPDRDFEWTTGPSLFGGNEIRHYFKIHELFDLATPFTMHRVQAIMKTLNDVYKVEE